MMIRVILAMALAISPFIVHAQFDPKLQERADEAIEAFIEKNHKFEAFFEEAYGYVVFPSVGKGAIGIGGARGAGIAYEQGVPVGKARVTQLTIGFQFGGQSYREVIFFETEEDMERFKENKLEFAAQASAVAVKEGASADLAYRDGVAVFTMTKGGLMYEAAVGGQELKFMPFEKEN
jgi:lipid-binding SYLF domain-containing protein